MKNPSQSRLSLPSPIALQTFEFGASWILFVDEDLIVVNKPSGLLSVPGRGEDKQHCLVQVLAEHYPDVKIVHRLDMDTSGIMVLARNADAHRHLSRQFQDRITRKKYEAVCTGRLTLPQGDTKLPMRCDWENRPRQMVDFVHGKFAHTEWQKLQQSKTHFLIELTPITGRSHQLRLHMKSLGHPILGDNLYADPSSLMGSHRLMLHAKQLGFFHPTTEQWLEFSCPSNFSDFLS